MTVAGQPSGTVTLVFTDVEGSTRLLAELGQEAYGKSLGEHRRVVREAFDRHGGYEVDYEGDAFFYAFSAAADGIRAVTEAMAALAGGPIRIRVGIHTGEPGLDPPKYVGLDVHKAARIMAAAHGGQVVVSQTTRELIADPAPFLDLGEHRLKDFPGSERLFQLGEGHFPALRSLYGTNLPIPATPFLGRSRELADVTARIHGGARLLTLTGPGGTGKTRLAIQAAAVCMDEFRDGVWWVPLVAITDPGLVLGSIAQALGVQRQPGAEPADALATRLRGRRPLILLDNAEHLLAEVIRAVELMIAIEGPQIVVTSRERLQVDGEQVYPVPSLDPEGAIDLFTTRAAALDPEFRGAPAVAELCRRLDNLPLAIELAASRTSLFTPDELLRRLQSRLDLLRHPRSADPRRQTLRATIDWSYDLLEPAERELYARLSIFPDGCTLDAAEQICGGDFETLQSLLDKSLLRRVEGRFRMLETIRHHAAEKLSGTQRDETEKLLAAWCLQLAETSDPELRDPHRSQSLELLDAERASLRLALDILLARGDPGDAITLIVALGYFWWTRGDLLAEGLGRISAALDLEAGPALRGRLLFWASFLLDEAGDLEPAARYASEALACFRSEGDRLWSGRALLSLASIRADAGNTVEARTLLEESAPISRAAADLWGLAHEMNRLGITSDDPGEQRRFFEESRTLHLADGDAISVAIQDANLGYTAFSTGESERAAQFTRAAVEELAELRAYRPLAMTLETLALEYLERGDPRSAARLLGLRLSILRSIGIAQSPRDIADAAGTYAQTAAALGGRELEVELAATSDLDLGSALETALGLARQI